MGGECSWELAAGKEQNWFGSAFSEEQDGRNGGGGGMIVLPLCA